jgi:uncharacterized protein (DUF302 family)
MTATLKTHAYGITRTSSSGYDDTIARLRDLLKEEGFGVLTEIDVKRTLKEKIDKDIEPYIILGVCNPHFAARSIELEPDMGLLLPCNVIVRERGGAVHVGVINPQSILEATANPALAEIAAQVDDRLRRVLEKL